MQLQAFEHGSVQPLSLRLLEEGVTLEPERQVELDFAPGSRLCILRQGGRSVAVQGSSLEDQQQLTYLLSLGMTRVSWLALQRNSALMVQCHLFPRVLELEELHIQWTEASFGALRRRGCRSLEEMQRWLQEQFVLSLEAQDFVLVSLDQESEELDRFVLHGVDHRAHIRRVQGQGHLLERLAPSHAAPSYEIYLGRGPVSFGERREAERAQRLYMAQVEQVPVAQRFLGQWRQYVHFEQELLLDKARAIGNLPYTLCADRQKQVEVTLGAELPEALSKGDALNLYGGQEPPAALPEQLSSLVGHRAKRADAQAEVLELDRRNGSLTLKVQRGVAPPDGWLALDLGGDSVRQERREAARTRIDQLAAPMPHLKLLLENIKVPTGRRSSYQALSPQVLRKIFPRHRPNLNQELAIQAALETPDLLLIQGPPGTGKTTVIRAIAERLHELIDDGQLSTGRFLITSFQHDAVENAAERVDLLGLPTLKLGQRNGTSSVDLHHQRVQQWGQERAQELLDSGVTLESRDLYYELHQRVVSYETSPSDLAEAAALLRSTLELVAGLAPTELHLSVLALADELERQQAALERNPVQRWVAKAIRALRVDPEGFADDGPQRASALLHLPGAASLLSAQDREVLEAALDPDAGPEVLWRVQRLRRRLLSQAIPSPLLRKPRVLPEVQEELRKLLRCAEENQRGPGTTLADFAHQLGSEPERLRMAILENTPVFAATCQQAASQKVLGQTHKQDMVYDAVLVDEAARCNPPDLLIPMAMGRQRIILVGDHKQLPHLVEEEVARRMEEDLPELDGQSLIKQSLFERLFDSFQALQREDPTQPRRAITLNEQYRMHPVLGQVVSDSFYEGLLRSPRPASDFQHQLPGAQGKAAAWLDVAQGPCRRQGTSWVRPSEVAALAAQLASWMRSPQGQGLSFGVISFYKAQVLAIQEALRKEGIWRDDQLAPEWAEGWSGEGERLRVGTVDAFQGREFDVVFLSMVRSAPQGRAARSPRALFGHVASPNRLCVSISRQKRLLVVVGDRRLLAQPGAQEHLGALLRLDQICQEGKDGTQL